MQTLQTKKAICNIRGKYIEIFQHLAHEKWNKWFPTSKVPLFWRKITKTPSSFKEQLHVEILTCDFVAVGKKSVRDSQAGGWENSGCPALLNLEIWAFNGLISLENVSRCGKSRFLQGPSKFYAFLDCCVHVPLPKSF